MSGRNCGSCRFHSEFAGECRFEVPVVSIQGGAAVWPKVGQLDWCGKFEPGPSGAPSEMPDPKKFVTLASAPLAWVPTWAAEAAKRFLDGHGRLNHMEAKYSLAKIFKSIREESAKELDQQAESVEATRLALKVSDQAEAISLHQQYYALRAAARHLRETPPKL